MVRVYSKYHKDASLLSSDANVSLKYNASLMSERGAHAENIPSHPIVEYENTIVNTTTCYFEVEKG